MKNKFLEIAGVATEEEFYDMFPTQEAFFEAYPEARRMKKGGNVPTNPQLYSRVKSEAKQKFDRWPSAYGSAWLVKEYKNRGGGYRKAQFGGNMNPSNNLGAFQQSVQQNQNPFSGFMQTMNTIKQKKESEGSGGGLSGLVGTAMKFAPMIAGLPPLPMEYGGYMGRGGKMPQWLAEKRFRAAGNQNMMDDYGYRYGGMYMEDGGVTNAQLYAGLPREAKHKTLYDAVKMFGVNPSFSNRKKLFNDMFGGKYTGTAKQNMQLLNMINSGELDMEALANNAPVKQSKKVQKAAEKKAAKEMPKANADDLPLYAKQEIQRERERRAAAGQNPNVIPGGEKDFNLTQEQRYWENEPDLSKRQGVKTEDGWDYSLTPEQQAAGSLDEQYNRMYGSDEPSLDDEMLSAARSMSTTPSREDIEANMPDSRNPNVRALDDEMLAAARSMSTTPSREDIEGAMPPRLPSRRRRAPMPQFVQDQGWSYALTPEQINAGPLSGNSFFPGQNPPPYTYTDENGFIYELSPEQINAGPLGAASFFPGVTDPFGFTPESYVDEDGFTYGLTPEQINAGPLEGDDFFRAGGIPDRYRKMGFSRVGQKKSSNRDGKKWMVLAEKNGDYKVVHGGYEGMKDFSQHGDEKRKDRFWDRMGGRDSARANDPFSPLYWHKKFGTWQEGGQIPPMDIMDIMKRGGSISIDPSKRGTFKAQATRMGMGVQEAANTILNAPEGRYTPAMRRKANFARNFAKQEGGQIMMGDTMELDDAEIQRLMDMGYGVEYID